MTIQIPQETLNEWEARDARFRANGWTEDAISSWYEFVKVAEIQSINKPKDPKPEEPANYQDWAKTVSVKENVVDGSVKSRLVTFSDGYTSYRVYPVGEEPKSEEFDESKPIVF
jgi:hypothetical protein